ncbi:hypothetical protein [Pedobacter yonginense]|uniref:hypothetical protein n=1 Tax=Pedobacter yonginense TaxID=651869 RepID=UPI0014038111|nr:hypothetical protein [Pedobacter yonginense]
MKTEEVELGLENLSPQEMAEIDGGRSIFGWIGYGVGEFVGLASWVGAGLAGCSD